MWLTTRKWHNEKEKNNECWLLYAGAHFWNIIVFPCIGIPIIYSLETPLTAHKYKEKNQYYLGKC